MDLTFRFRLTPAEHARAGRLALKGTRHEYMWTGVSAVLSFTTILLLTFWWSDLSPASRVLLATPLLLLLLLSILSPVITRFQLGRAYRRDPLVFSEQVLTLSRDGLAVESEAGLTTLRWAAIREVREHEDFYYFFFTPKCAYFLPKRVVPTEQHHREVRDLSRAHARHHNLAQKDDEVPITATSIHWNCRADRRPYTRSGLVLGPAAQFKR